MKFSFKRLRRSVYRWHVRSLNLVFKSSVEHILLIAVVATIIFKYKDSIFPDKQSPEAPLYFDYYKAEPRMMLPEYMEKLQRESE